MANTRQHARRAIQNSRVALEYRGNATRAAVKRCRSDLAIRTAFSNTNASLLFGGEQQAAAVSIFPLSHRKKMT